MSNVTCEDCSDDCLVLSNISTFQILALLLPTTGKGTWTPITQEWLGMFYLFVALSIPIYLFIGVACLVFLYKRRVTKRFKTKSFVAIDVTLSILGFSRVLFFIIDPYGVAGFCTHDACVVVSRLLYSLGFPSLTASYTLVFLTLWQSAKLRLRKSTAEHWNIVIPLCCIHYVVAVVVEIIGLVGPYPVVFLLIGCEVVFLVWGLIVCVAFIVAGSRLLRSVRRSAHQSSVVCRDTTLTREPSTPNKMASKVQTMRMKGTFRRHHKQAIRKVTIITYVAAVLGCLYSVIGLVQLVLNVMELFGTCTTNYTSNSALWLFTRYALSGVEVALALLLMYSSNDLRPFVQRLKALCSPKNTASVDDRETKDSKSNLQFSYDSKEKYINSNKETSSTGGSTIRLPEEKSNSNNVRYTTPDSAQDTNSNSS